ncbi:hypothetical protein Sgleb_61170 [Streptomyces glebosus]|uniref:Uncharacterized protein n=1 Tax=Streptomyces glebosus TaxID=249580 RepID=A0A640T4E7_9ACTN|nr:hypothetical protein Sgleb_61170 [Streptomyces glebosus]GHG46201.1 hypothetical protein GCM10010513_01830 [Streptomyces glebosus]
MSRIAVSAAKRGLGVAAAAVGASLGPVGGAATAKVIEQVGGDMLDSAATSLANRRAGNAPPSDQEQDGDAEEPVEETETVAEGPRPRSAQRSSMYTTWPLSLAGWPNSRASPGP